MKTFLSSLRGRFILLLLLIVLPLSAMMYRSGLEERNQSAAIVQADALRLARIAAQNQEVLIDQTLGFLLALSHTVGSDQKTLAQCQGVFEHLSQAHFPYYTGFYLADLEGNLLCLSPGEVPKIRTCQHYAELVRSTDFVISNYHLCQNSGEGVISIGYPVRDKDDQVIGVVNAGIDLKWFNQLAEQYNLPTNSELIVFNEDLVILTHYPDPQLMIGEDMPDDKLTNTMLEQMEGTIQGKGLDGVERLYAFVPLWRGETKVLLTIGIPAAAAYGPVNRRTLLNLGLIAFTSFAAVAIAWRFGETGFLRPIKAIIDTTKSLAQGDLSVRSQLPYERGELGSLAQAVDQLAEALVQHEAERDQNEKEIQEYAENLEKTNRELRDFNSIASHDLQEPARKLQMYSDLLLSRYGGELDETGKKHLFTLNRAAQRMQRLILDLLDYSHVTTRALPFQSVKLGSVMEEVLSDLEAQVTETGAKIEIADLPAIEADAAQLHRLFMNLISNSMKFHKPAVPPHIRISSQIEADEKLPGHVAPWVKIFVADDGIGFDEKYLERIFQPFESLHSPDEYPGTGIGLAICRKIVERHGGSITATSKPDQGAVFIVTLPMKHPTGGS